jgi:hypothetical protein
MTIRALLTAAGVAATAFVGSTAGHAVQPERPRIYGISHVTFRVSDMAAAQTFYGG